MRTLATEVKQRLVEGNADADMVCHMKNLLNIAVCNAMYDGFFLMDRTPESILRELRADGVYPQPFNRKYLRIKSLRETVFNYIRFLFPIPLYYSLITRLIRLVLKLIHKL